jgi:hypothetical protein
MLRWLCKLTTTFVISILGVFSGPLSAQAEVTLRDAIYLYNQDLYAGGQTEIGSLNCDVFQLVLDVESGYSDLLLFKKDSSSSPWISSRYPDRIYSNAAMFAYMQYGTSTAKSFMFDDKNLPTSATNKIGKATVFGYCLSSNPSAFVFLVNKAACTYKYSNGTTSPISGCTPVGN